MYGYDVREAKLSGAVIRIFLESISCESSTRNCSQNIGFGFAWMYYGADMSMCSLPAHVYLGFVVDGADLPYCWNFGGTDQCGCVSASSTEPNPPTRLISEEPQH